LYPFPARAARMAGIATAAVLLLAVPGSATAQQSGFRSGGAAASGTVTCGKHQSFGPSRHLGDRVLCEGMRGHDVRVLQDFLTIAGFPVKVSGYFGPVTLRSVIAFQRAHKMLPDGVVTLSVERSIRRMVVIKTASFPPGKANINPNGTATAPPGAPPAVRAMIAAGNRILHTYYCYAGGHGSWNDSCYDCSGSVSYVLHAAGMLDSPEASTGLESWGSPGRGRWITVYANSAHTWIAIAGRAFDTADFGGPDILGGSGPRWRWNPTGNFGDGMSYVARHPRGL